MQKNICKIFPVVGLLLLAGRLEAVPSFPSNPCPGSGTVFVLSDSSFSDFSSVLIASKIAGTPFSTTITNYGNYTDGLGSPQCGVNTTYTGTHSLTVTYAYVDPSSGSKNLLLDPTGGSSFATIDVPSSITFTNGVAVVTFRYDDVGSIQMGVSDGVSSGGTHNFVVKPYDFVITSIPGNPTDPADQTAPVFKKAGAPFTVKVEARNAVGGLTPNYGQESSPAGIEIYSTQLVSPSGGRNGSDNSGTLLQGSTFTADTNPGAFVNTQVAFDEVGIIKLKAHVQGGSYLGAGDVASTAASAAVGRFTPDHFVVSAGLSGGQFSTACASDDFNYLGKPLIFATKPSAQVTAVASAGTTTQNYTGAYWKLSEVSGTMSSSSVTGVINPVATSMSMDNSGSPADPSLGQTLYQFTSDANFAIAQPATGVLVAPFLVDIALTYSLTDSDGVTGAQPSYAFGSVSDGIPFSNSKQMRQGRLHLVGAQGPVGLAMNLPLSVEYYDGTGFSANTADSNCTGLLTLPTLKDASQSYLSTLTVTNHDSGGPDSGYFESGRRTITLKLPSGYVGGTPAAGYVDVTFDLSTTFPWLMYPWSESSNNPIARAFFGVPGSDAPVIFRQEVYPKAYY